MTAALFCLLAFAQVSAAGQTTPIAVQVSAAPPKIGESLRPIPFWQVKLEDDFWAPRIRTTIEKTIPACFDQCEKTGRIANWEKAAKKEGKFEGYFFNDSDVYKVIEAAAYALKLDPNATYKGRKLDEYLDELIAKIAAMQQPDGYVNSYFVLTGEPKWTDIEHKHELYCAGHLIEAAVAHFQCTGKRNLLDVAIKLADNICNTFGPEPGKNANPCGHAEIELALLRLADLLQRTPTSRAPTVRERNSARGNENPLPHGRGSASTPTNTQESGDTNAESPGRYDLQRALRYGALAKYFVDQHGNTTGRAKLWGEYAQDHKPLKEQTEIVGHAVRAMYLLSAATDIARESYSASEYQTALGSLWRDLTQRKMYITGGIGNSAQNEGFTTAYDLPNDTAYAETCASIGLVFWAHRMNLLHADGQYFDVLERALYNNVLAAISLDGTQFNYVNPLASRGQHRRQPWHACACCPPNLARLFPTVGGYMYAQSDKAIYVNMYAKSTATFQHGDAMVTIKQDTKYPWDEKVEFVVSVDRPCEFDLKLRIPGWSRFPMLTVSDERIAQPQNERGYAVVRRSWEKEIKISLENPMPVESMRCDPRVKANIGRIAIQCGPLVYCLESPDNSLGVRELFLKWALDSVPMPGQPEKTLPIRYSFERGSGILSSASLLKGKIVGRRQAESAHDGLYCVDSNWEPASVVLVPYFAWNNREAGDMLVWIPESPAFLDPQPVAWLKPSASHCWKLDTLAALHDRQEPSNSSDAGIPRFTWWPKKGDEQWVQYDFDKPRTISAVDVYWFDDARHGAGCKPPASWKLQYKRGGDWADARIAPPPAPDAAPAYGIADDRFNRVAFDPVETTGLRIVAELADGFSAGILEWKVE